MCCVIRVDMRRSPLVDRGVECRLFKFVSGISCVGILPTSFTGFGFRVIGGKVVWSF